MADAKHPSVECSDVHISTAFASPCQWIGASRKGLGNATGSSIGFLASASIPG
jgi:hypothetical protein